MSVQFSYQDLWAFYHQASTESKKSILEQISHILDTVSTKVRIEILKDAPDELYGKYNAPIQQKQKTRTQLEKELRRYIR